MSEAVVVAHGLWMPGAETWLLRKRLAAQGYAAYVFRYRTVSDGLERNAELLDAYLEQLRAETIHLVGYSLGGVVSVETLRGHRPQRLGRLVCLGAPLNGSATARALRRLPLGGTLLGRSMTELVEAGGLAPWRGSVEIGVVAGDLGVGLGRVLGALQGPNDGTVAVDETRLDGLTDHIVRHVSHTTMLFSRVVAEDTLHFIRHGRF